MVGKIQFTPVMFYVSTTLQLGEKRGQYNTGFNFYTITNMRERFKAPDGYPLYKVSSYGYVIGARGKELKGERIKGYTRVALSHEGKVRRFSIHRLVATLFKKRKPHHTQVNHLDGKKWNNNASNLKWCTSQQNVEHCIKNGLQKLKGSDNPSSKLTDKQVRRIKSFKGKMAHHKIAAKFDVSRTMVSFILKGRNWSHIN